MVSYSKVGLLMCVGIRFHTSIHLDGMFCYAIISVYFSATSMYVHCAQCAGMDIRFRSEDVVSFSWTETAI